MILIFLSNFKWPFKTGLLYRDHYILYIVMRSVIMSLSGRTHLESFFSSFQATDFGCLAAITCYQISPRRVE